MWRKLVKIKIDFEYPYFDKDTILYQVADGTWWIV